MEIACLHCGLFRSESGARADARASSSDAAGGALDEPCPRCSERAILLGAQGLARSGTPGVIEPRREWHIMLRGLQRGPYTSAELLGLLETHEEGREAAVWRAGMSGWEPACEVEGLTRSVASAAHVVTDVVSRREALAPGVPSGAARGSRASRSAGETTLRIQAVASGPAHTSVLHAALGASVAFAVVAAYLWLHPSVHSTPVPSPPRAAAQATAVVAAPQAPQHVESAPVVSPPPPLPVAEPRSVPEPAAAVSGSRADSRVATDVSLGARASSVAKVRIRAHWAPIRQTTDAEGQVVCSLPRGTPLAVLAQAPGRRGRWFEVRCDAHRMGWVHENFLRHVQ